MSVSLVFLSLPQGRTQDWLLYIPAALYIINWHIVGVQKNVNTSFAVVLWFHCFHMSLVSKALYVPRFVTMLQLCKMLRGWQAYGTSMYINFFNFLWIYCSKALISPNWWDFHLPSYPHHMMFLACWTSSAFSVFSSSTSNNPTSYNT